MATTSSPARLTQVTVFWAEVEEQVTEWKAKRQTDKLEKRAERAEEYAETCVAVALASAAEAEEAILEALAARMDADNA